MLVSPFDTTSLLLGGAVLLCLLWWLSTRRPSGLPPGPGRALPLLGHLHLMPKDPRPLFWAWRRQYGDVFSLYMGGRLVVVLASYSAIREAFVTMADVFSDRPQDFISAQMSNYKGVVGSSGPNWKEQRKTSTEILRVMGMGKNLVAEKIQEEITHFIRVIKDHQGSPMDLTGVIQASVSNNICSIMFGRRFHPLDPEFLTYMRRIKRIFELLGGTAIVNFLPVVKYLPGDLFRFKECLDNTHHIHAYVDKHVAANQQTLDKEENQEKEEKEEEKEKGQQTNFIHSYLQRMRTHKKTGRVDSMLDGENLQKILGDLFMGGTETTSTFLRWILLYFLHFPHIQDKCFQEVSQVVGPDRPPTMQDRAKMTYLQATVYEVLRKANVIPFAVMHAPARDVIFRSYVIPRGTMIIPDLDCVLQDPDIWGDPENLRPERFIGPDGKLIQPDEFIPFGIGRRVCLGESLARMELFLYVATLLQHFHFLPPQDGQLPSLEGVFGLAHMPQPYTIRAVPRM